MPRRSAEYRCTDYKSVFQVGWTIAVYFLLWGIALAAAAGTFAASLVLALVLGMFHVRIFNIQHDCTHHSYFTRAAANDAVGLLLGVLTLTPHFYWTRNHLRHHGTSGDLDRRGFGDIYVHTVREFKNLSRARQIFYLLYRNPFVYLLIGPMYHFMLKMRVPQIAKWRSKDRLSIHFVNAMIAVIFTTVLLCYDDPLKFFILYFISTMVGGAIGLWLFYVQHQFDGAYWRRSSEWRFSDASLQGSSFLKLPRFFEWFFVYINLHHVHHLYPRTPNYFLRSRMKEMPAGMRLNPEITFLESIRAFRLKLWDEDAQKMVDFGAAARQPEPC